MLLGQFHLQSSVGGKTILWPLTGEGALVGETIAGHGRVFSGYTHISRVRPHKSSCSVSVFVSSLSELQRFKNTYSGSSWSSSSEKQESRWYSSFVLVFPSFTCTHVLTPTQPCCVLHFSPWQQVSKDREDLCAGCPPPAASSPLLLDTFVVKRVVVQSQPDSPIFPQP